MAKRIADRFLANSQEILLNLRRQGLFVYPAKVKRTADKTWNIRTLRQFTERFQQAQFLDDVRAQAKRRTARFRQTKPRQLVGTFYMALCIFTLSRHCSCRGGKLH